VRLDAVWKREHVDAPLHEPSLKLPYRVGVLGLGVLAPLLVHLLQVVTGRELRTASSLASVAALIGGYAQRAVMIFAGKRSAERPTDYFRFTRA
jgi:formate-dependent nitrite reductase membrane component NrfD